MCQQTPTTRWSYGMRRCPLLPTSWRSLNCAMAICGMGSAWERHQPQQSRMLRLATEGPNYSLCRGVIDRKFVNVIASSNVEIVLAVECEPEGDVIRNRDHVKVTTIARENLDSFDVGDIDSPLSIYGNRIHRTELPRLVAFFAKFVDEISVLRELEDGIIEA